MTPYKMPNLVYERVNFSKFSHMWAENFGKFRWFCLKCSPKLAGFKYEWIIFCEKLIFVQVCFQIPQPAVQTYQNQTQVPPGNHGNGVFHAKYFNIPHVEVLEWLAKEGVGLNFKHISYLSRFYWYLEYSNDLYT